MWQFDSRKGPLYQQLADHLVFQILQGQLNAGDKLPSARELAVDAGLNPNTVIQAFQELEKRGISETKRGKGTFVREDANTKKLRKERLAVVTQNYLDEIRALGLQPEDAIQALQEKSKNDR
jgi:GntR family transcriptional regulator